MKRLPLVACALAPLFAFAAPSADIAETPAVLPRPVKLEVSGKTGFGLAGTVNVAPSADFPEAVRAVKDGLGLSGVACADAASGDRIAFKKVSDLGKEAYRITVTPTAVVIEASAAAGAFYGAQTLVQSVVKDAAGKPALPAMTVNDAPRFGWRGLMVDSARHFFPPAAMKRFIDLMAMHKLNTLHWHLTEDQGWRIEIRKYPKLTTVGATRKGEHIAGQAYYKADNTKPYGPFFYTQDEIRDIVAYAKARAITIIPEIEMPGHAAAAIAAYPELGNKDIPGYKPEVKTAWGVHDYTFAPSETTFAFLDDVIGEVAALFPDAPYIHVGGDECPKGQWNKSAFVKKLMAEKKLKDTHEVQSYFIGRAEKMINARGKRIIGWDEIQEGGLSKTATMMVWRNWKWAIEAVNHGNDVVMAPTSNTYFDYSPGKRPAGPGFQVIGGNLSLERVYGFEPIPKELKPEQYKHILGCQAQLWSEYIRTPGKWEYMAFPRAIALAEVAWSPRDGKDFKEFSARLEKHKALLDALKVNYRNDDGSPAQPDAKLLNE